MKEPELIQMDRQPIHYAPHMAHIQVLLICGQMGCRGNVSLNSPEMGPNKMETDILSLLTCTSQRNHGDGFLLKN
jgi:hypothetical protein